MPAPQSLQSSGLTLSETSIGSFKRRKRKSIIVTVMLLIVSVLILIFGLAATTRTQNITVGGYYSGVILGFGSFLGIIGAHLIENKRQMLVASIVFISFGVVAAFCCAIVDGVFAARHIDLRPLYAGRCAYHTSDTASEHDVPCHTAGTSCNLRVKSNTCYCCDLYNCGKEHPLMGPQNKDVLKKFKKSSMIWKPSRVELMGGYHEYTDVKSCQDVIHLYHLLWSATILNIVALFLGIITAAVLGGFKDMTPAPASESTSEPEAITAPVPSEIPPPTTSLNPYYNTAPCLPPYSAYDLQGSYVFPDSSGLSDDSQSGASHLWPTMIPPRYSPPHNLPDEKPPPYSP
ncbi:transmembrane protein 255A isoform X1 [Oreochromis niloticus]|uniref:transmembrane protein 255A isoform X1 n=1 Tax=Oreochromis niloticus TaxID=8128 RepID=UPI000394159A|nr:transmembrane protein 255A isoform X1 [Oreochromis niloticus]XP_005467460.1 transmembrane protein 255A isoform X1 [Oreochromis niloticus]XP_039476079.1 transmembrane protein 255A isoform X2 [Oreochromis aureus]